MRLDDPSCGRYAILRSMKGMRVARRIQKKEPSYDASPAEAEYIIETTWMDLRCFSRAVYPWRPVKYLDFSRWHGRSDELSLSLRKYLY